MKIQWKNTILLRLIITFFAIIIPIYGLGYIMYYNGQDIAKKQIIESMAYRVGYYKDTLERDISRIHQLNFFYSENESLKYLVRVKTFKANDYDHVRTIQDLRSDLFTLKNSSMYIDDVKLRMYGINKVISVNEGIDDLDPEYHNQLSTELKKDNQIIVHGQGDIKISESYFAVDLKDKLLPKFTIEVDLSVSRIQKYLSELNEFGEQVYLLDDQDQILVSVTQNRQSIDAIKNAIADLSEDESGSFDFNYENEAYIGFYDKSELLGMTIITYVAQSTILAPLTRYLTWFIFFTLTSFALILFYSLYTYNLFYNPLSTLVNAFKMVEKGDLSILIESDQKNEFGYLFKAFNKMVGRLGDFIDRSYKQKIMIQKATLKHLQSQINPHFLYNSFFILFRRIKVEDIEGATYFCEQLGKYFQFITKSDLDTVDLATEIQHAKIYTDIQKVRFSDRISVQFEALQPEDEHIMVPHLTIQPLLENAYKYGVEDMSSGGLISLSFERQGHLLRIKVEDNGIGMNPQKIKQYNEYFTDDYFERAMVTDNQEDTTEISGMINVDRRLKLMLGQQSKLHLDESSMGGLKVTITIDCDYKGDYHGI